MWPKVFVVILVEIVYSFHWSIVVVFLKKKKKTYNRFEIALENIIFGYRKSLKELFKKKKKNFIFKLLKKHSFALL